MKQFFYYCSITFLILVVSNKYFLVECKAQLFEVPQTFQESNILIRPRVVTDLETIYGCHGVPIDFTYNETTSGKGTQLTSVPGCPQSIDGLPWIYYGNLAKCFLAGFRGPCKTGEKLWPRRGSPIGQCACECLLDDDNGILLWRKSPGRYQFCRNGKSKAAPHGQIYDWEENKCYNMFDKDSGPCEPESGITEWTTDTLKCFPLCKEDTRGLITLVEPRQQENCKKIPWYPVAVAGPTSVLQNQQCPNGQRYSTTLKTCVKNSVPLQ